MASNEPNKLPIPEIFSGEIPEDFIKEAASKYRLPRQSRAARFLNRLFYYPRLDEGMMADTLNRALYSLAIAQQSEEEQRHLAESGRLDDITDLLNGRAFRDEADKRLAELDPDERRRQIPNAALVVHLDGKGQKEVNDTKGHEAGNTNLRHIGRTLLKVVRQGDLASRTGGDEFAAVLFYHNGLISDEEMKSAIDSNLFDFVKEAVDLGEISGAKWCSINAQPGETISQALHRADPIRSNPLLMEYPPQDVLPDRS